MSRNLIQMGLKAIRVILCVSTAAGGRQPGTQTFLHQTT